MAKNKRIIKILFDNPINKFVIKGSSAPAFTNCPITCGNTKVNKAIITTIENPIKIIG